MVSPDASISHLPSRTPFATTAICSPSIAISAATMPPGATMLPPRITRSRASSDIAYEPQANVESSLYIGGDNGLIRMVADPTGTPQEQHRSGHMRRKNHGVV